MQTLNWYPGHMKKTRELIRQNMKLVDAAIEVLDARIPISGRNPIIKELTGQKQRIVVLNKSDLADPKANEAWIRQFQKEGSLALPLNSKTGIGVKSLLKLLEKLQEQKNKDQIRKRPYRIMIVGVPNAGKSSLINRLVGKKSTQIGDRPGITKGKQWLNLLENMQLLDTPGILWPKFEDPKVGRNLAFCGSIRDEIMDMPALALELIRVLSRDYSELLCRRYKLESCSGQPIEIMEAMGKNRGCLLSGGKTDYQRIAIILLDEFRSGTIGKITLEKPEQKVKAKEKADACITAKKTKQRQNKSGKNT